MSIRVLHGDCRTILATLPDASVQCCVTSPPYFGLRDYGVAGQIGLEASPDAYIAEMVAVFREVRRVLRDDGTLWLNLGDSYARGGRGGGMEGDRGDKQRSNQGALLGPKKAPDGFKPKDLMMMPARVALALQADGWWLRSDIIWTKPNPMPESVVDRPTSAHEHVFLLTKSARYYFDADAVREAGEMKPQNRFTDGKGPKAEGYAAHRQPTGMTECISRNIRNVWTIATAPFPDAHFATFPPELAERCIKAGSKPGDTILDPFAGAFTAPLVADRLQRNAIGIELSPTYCEMARDRLLKDAGMFAEVA